MNNKIKKKLKNIVLVITIFLIIVYFGFWVFYIELYTNGQLEFQNFIDSPNFGTFKQFLDRNIVFALGLLWYCLTYSDKVNFKPYIKNNN